MSNVDTPIKLGERNSAAQIQVTGLARTHINMNESFLVAFPQQQRIAGRRETKGKVPR
jgi:hypothetical protein